MAALVLCLAALLPARPATTASPPAVIWSPQPYIHWIKQTSAPLDQFTILINGAGLTPAGGVATKYQDSLHVTFYLAYGKHSKLEVRQQGQTIYQADVFYAPSYVPGSIIPEGAITQPFHIPDNEKPCQGCHRLTPTPEDDNPPDIHRQMCYPCHHREYDHKKYLHAPGAMQWSCTQCHDPEPKKTRKRSPAQRFLVLTRDDAQPTCYDCHDSLKARNQAYAYVHGPIAMGACTICHNPHAADLPHLIQDDVTHLCVNCHGLGPMLKKKVVHPILTQKGCIVCHDAHGSNNPRELVKPMYELCTGCHPALLKKRFSHPVDGHPTYIPATTKGGKDTINCVSCHSPHSSDYPRMLPAGELVQVCTHCHTAKAR